MKISVKQMNLTKEPKLFGKDAVLIKGKKETKGSSERLLAHRKSSTLPYSSSRAHLPTPHCEMY